MFKALPCTPLACTLLAFTLLVLPTAQTALAQEPAVTGVTTTADSAIKYAIYSSAWGLNSNAGLRLLAHNRSAHNLQLAAVVFDDDTDIGVGTRFQIALDIPAQGWAEVETPYIDLLSGSECVRRSMAEGWKLVEISNHTLNPSVRGLIIEDTNSFRIFQCVRNVTIHWQGGSSAEAGSYSEWVMYHFERRAQP